MLSKLSDKEHPFLWCGNNSLQLLVNDCCNAIDNAALICNECNFPDAEFCCYFNRLLAAARYAMPIQDAGVCVT